MKINKLTARCLLALAILCLVPAAASADNAAQTPEEYLVTFVTMLNRTQSRLDLMNRPSFLARIGSEEQKGLRSGTLSYSTVIKGLSGVVTLAYDNYSDDAGWVFNGAVTVSSNMSANGTFGGSLTVTGVNPGIVYYDKLILKGGKPAGGTYGVQLPGKARVEVDYTYYFEAE